MPGGSKYPGPAERLSVYRDLVERHGAAEVKGAKNPYTSLNGWMTSFLDPDGIICLRLGSEDRAVAIDAGANEVQQYGRNMPDFVGLPLGISQVDADLWFDRSWAHTGLLVPK